MANAFYALTSGTEFVLKANEPLAVSSAVYTDVYNGDSAGIASLNPDGSFGIVGSGLLDVQFALDGNEFLVGPGQELTMTVLCDGQEIGRSTFTEPIYGDLALSCDRTVEAGATVTLSIVSNVDATYTAQSNQNLLLFAMGNAMNSRVRLYTASPLALQFNSIVKTIVCTAPITGNEVQITYSQDGSSNDSAARFSIPPKLVSCVVTTVSGEPAAANTVVPSLALCHSVTRTGATLVFADGATFDGSFAIVATVTGV
jgi:hypothetical protein